MALFDLRFSKRFAVGQSTITGNFDIYNLFNENNVLNMTTRFGPAKLSGEARSEKWGSVRMLDPPTRRSTVACPTQVSDGLAVSTGVAVLNRYPPSGRCGRPSRSRCHCQRQNPPFSACG